MMLARISNGDASFQKEQDLWLRESSLWHGECNLLIKHLNQLTPLIIIEATDLSADEESKRTRGDDLLNLTETILNFYQDLIDHCRTILSRQGLMTAGSAAEHSRRRRIHRQLQEQNCQIKRRLSEVTGKFWTRAQQHPSPS